MVEVLIKKIKDIQKKKKIPILVGVLVYIFNH